MKFLAIFLYAILALSSFLSCSKETGTTPDAPPPPPPPPPPPTAPPPAVLSSIKSYKLNGSTDTVVKMLEYDQLNRIIKIREFKNGVEGVGGGEIKFLANKIISLYSSSDWPHINSVDTIELDAYKMPVKRISNYTITENAAGTIWNVYFFQTTDYFYRVTGEYDSEKTYIDDSSYFQSPSQFVITKRLDTITNEVIAENDNIKTLKKTSKNNRWQWDYGVLTYTRNTAIDETDYLYTKNYPNHPANEFNYLNFIYGFYYPYMYFNNRKNFKNIADKFVYRNSTGSREINYTITYTDKGYIKSLQSDIPADWKLEFSYK